MTASDVHPDPIDAWPSPGVRVIPFADAAVAFDLATSTVHVLSPVGALLLTGSGPDTIDELQATAALQGADPDEVRNNLLTGIAGLQSLGLVGRTTPYAPPKPPGTAGHPDHPGRYIGVTHAIAAHRVAFRSDDRTLLGAIDTSLGDSIDEPATQFFDATITEHDGVDLFAPDTWCFPSRDALLAQLPNVLNDHAARSHDLLVVHAGAVRTPDGRLVAVAGHPDAGKSTLVGALVAAGCDYLGDESIGLRRDLIPLGYPKPLTLDTNSRSVLGLPGDSHPHIAPEAIRSDVTRLTRGDSPIDSVVVVGYRPDAPFAATRLEPIAALEAVASHLLNLPRAGDEGLHALCALAERIPVWNVSHPGVATAVPWVLQPPDEPQRP